MVSLRFWGSKETPKEESKPDDAAKKSDDVMQDLSEAAPKPEESAKESDATTPTPEEVAPVPDEATQKHDEEVTQVLDQEAPKPIEAEPVKKEKKSAKGEEPAKKAEKDEAEEKPKEEATETVSAEENKEQDAAPVEKAVEPEPVSESKDSPAEGKMDEEPAEEADGNEDAPESKEVSAETTQAAAGAPEPAGKSEPVPASTEEASKSAESETKSDLEAEESKPDKPQNTELKSPAEVEDPPEVSLPDDADTKKETPKTEDGKEGKQILTDDDELFLRRVTTQGDLPTKSDEKESDEASKVALPPATPLEEKSAADLAQQDATKVPTWSDRLGQLGQYVPSGPTGMPTWVPALPTIYGRSGTEKEKDKAEASNSANDAAEKANNESPEDAHKERRDLSSILSNLKLSSINNRIVGISNETQELLESFNTVLKDVINGAPSAYEDLDKLLSERQGQLDQLFGTLPPFMQVLVKSVPAKLYSSMAPQLSSALSAKAEAAGKPKEEVQAEALEADDHEDLEASDDESMKAAAEPEQKGMIPSLKRMVSERSYVVAMLKSIVNFLELRFPAFLTGTNMIMSVAVFVLLFVFWYSHKRGREVRLAKSTHPADPSLADLERNASLEDSAKAAASDKQDVPDVPLPKGDSAEKKDLKGVPPKKKKGGLAPLPMETSPKKKTSPPKAEKPEEAEKPIESKPKPKEAEKPAESKPAKVAESSKPADSAKSDENEKPAAPAKTPAPKKTAAPTKTTSTKKAATPAKTAEAKTTTTPAESKETAVKKKSVEPVKKKSVEPVKKKSAEPLKKKESAEPVPAE